MQVSSWMAARLAVLVEFAVFLISSTKRGSVELFFYKNEFALVYRLGDA